MTRGPLKKLGGRHNNRLIYDTEKCVGPSRSRLRFSREREKEREREREKKVHSYIPARSSAGERESMCNFPSSGQAHSFSSVARRAAVSSFTQRERTRSLRKERSFSYGCLYHGPERKTKSPYLKQTLTLQIKRENGFLCLSKISVYFLFPPKAEHLNIPELHPVFFRALWQRRDTRSDGLRGGRARSADVSPDVRTEKESLPPSFLTLLPSAYRTFSRRISRY